MGGFLLGRLDLGAHPPYGPLRCAYEELRTSVEASLFEIGQVEAER